MLQDNGNDREREEWSDLPRNVAPTDVLCT